MAKRRLRWRLRVRAARTRLLRFIDAFIPPELLNYDHPENLYRARVMLCVPFAVGLSHIYSCVIMFQNRPLLEPMSWVLWVGVLGAVLLFASVALFRRTAAFLMCTNIYALGATLSLLSVIIVTGGFPESPFVVLLPLMVLFVFIMAKITTAIAWASIALVLWWIGVTLGDRGYPNLIPDEWMESTGKGTVLNAGITMIAILWFFDFFHRQLLGRLQLERDRALFSAAHDVLTGLANRKTFHTRLSHLIATQRLSGGLHALLLMDLNDFKLVNDTHGHACGDLMLKSVSASLAACVRRSDVAGRLGGDEFGVLLTDVRSADDLVPILEKILRAVTRPVTLSSGERISVGASIGVALLPDDGLEPEELLHKADLAMYRAKETARGYLFVRDDPASPLWRRG